MSKIDAGGDVANVHAVVDVFTEKVVHVLDCLLGEVLADLVGGDGRSGPQQGHREGPRTNAGLENAHPRTDVRLEQDGAEVLGVDHLGSARHLEHDVGQGGSKNEKLSLGARSDERSFRLSDDLIVLNNAGVGVKGRTFFQGDEVVTILRVDEHDALTRSEFGATHA
jgi:hypothetical protein